MHLENTFNEKQLEFIFFKNKQIANEIVLSYLKEDHDICIMLIEEYNLNLLKDRFIYGVSIQSYSGRKRKKLRKEMVKLIFLYEMYIYINSKLNFSYIDEYDIYKIMDLKNNKD